MTYQIVSGVPTPQSQENGEPWPFILLLDDENAMYTDSYTDILSALIDGYSDIPDDEAGDEQALIARVEHAVVLSSRVQAMLLHDAVVEGTFDMDSADEEVLSTLLSDRTHPIRDIDEWTHDVPLVLLTVDYDPYNVLHMPPNGNVVWLDPADEADYVRSLAGLGIINLFQLPSE